MVNERKKERKKKKNQELFSLANGGFNYKSLNDI